MDIDKSTLCEITEDNSYKIWILYHTFRSLIISNGRNGSDMSSYIMFTLPKLLSVLIVRCREVRYN